MIFFLITFISIIIFYFINESIKNYNFLLNYKGQKHQKFSGLINVPLSGGIFILEKMGYHFCQNKICGALRLRKCNKPITLECLHALYPNLRLKLVHPPKMELRYQQSLSVTAILLQRKRYQLPLLPAIFSQPPYTL